MHAKAEKRRKSLRETMNYEPPTTIYPNRLSNPHSQKVLEIHSITLFLCAFCAFLWLKNPLNQRNPRLINDLREYKSLYNCREIFTDVMSALQIRLFMQNEPNFRKSQMNVNKVLTRDYEKRTLGQHGKNEPKTNPKRTQTNPIPKRPK